MAGDPGACYLKNVLSTSPFFLCDTATLRDQDDCLGLGCSDERFQHVAQNNRDRGRPAETLWTERCSLTVTTGACCFLTVFPPPGGGEWDNPNDSRMIPRVLCRHIPKSDCLLGLTRQIVGGNPDDWTGAPASTCHVAVSLFEFFGNVKYRFSVSGPPGTPPDRQGIFDYMPLTPDRIRPSLYHDDSMLCQCSFNAPPFIDPQSALAGFTNCLRLPNVGTEWEDVCDLEIPDDEFQCQHVPFPLVIDADGFAAWDAGNRKLAQEPFAECEHVLADLYIDEGGFAHSLACTRRGDGVRPPEATVGDLSYRSALSGGVECVAMWQDFRWDDSFGCDN